MERGQRHIADAISGIAHKFAQMRERTDTINVTKATLAAVAALKPRARVRSRRLANSYLSPPMTC